MELIPGEKTEITKPVFRHERDQKRGSACEVRDVPDGRTGGAALCGIDELVHLDGHPHGHRYSHTTRRETYNARVNPCRNEK